MLVCEPDQHRDGIWGILFGNGESLGCRPPRVRSAPRRDRSGVLSLSYVWYD